jgi:hypothetical protein
MKGVGDLKAVSAAACRGKRWVQVAALACVAPVAVAGGPHGGGGHAPSGGGARMAPGHAAPAHFAAAPVYRAPAYQAPAYREPAYRDPAYREPAYREPATHLAYSASRTAAYGGAPAHSGNFAASAIHAPPAAATHWTSITPTVGSASFVRAAYQPGHDGGGHGSGGHGGAGPMGHGGGHPGYGGPQPGYGGPHPSYGGSYPGFASNQGVEIHHGGGNYWYHGGYWYRPGYRGWIISAPPYGAFVPWLPWGYTSFWYGGFPYYHYNNVYYVYRDVDRGYEVVQPPPGAEAAVSQAQADNLYVYPKNGQGPEQQATDRYECHRWATEQTGFDPTLAGGGVPQEETGQRRADYLRAMTSCLEGRGYSVR